MIWLSDGVDLGGGSEFVAALGALVGTRAITVIDGGLAPALALAGAENTAAALTVKVLRSAKGARAIRRRSAGSTSRACRSATRHSRSAPTRPRPMPR